MNQHELSDLLQTENQELGFEGRYTLWLLFRRYAGQPFQWDDLGNLAHGGFSGADVRIGFASLRKLGLIHGIRKTWGEKLYYIPAHELARLYPSIMAPLSPILEEQVILTQQSKLGIEHDLFRVLCWIAKKGIPVTGKGTIPVEVVAKLEAIIQLSRADVDALCLQYRHSDVYPAPVAVVMDLLQALGLIRRESQGWVVSEDTLYAWLSQSTTDWSEALFQQMLLRYIPGDAILQHCAYAMASDNLLHRKWYGVDELLGLLQEQGLINLTQAQSDINRAWIEGWMNLMCGCGWMELGYDEKQQFAFRWTRRMEKSDDQPTASKRVNSQGLFYVQPDFDVLVPPDVPSLVRWELEMCCEIVVMDTMSIYHITRESLTDALEHGRTLSGFIQFMEQGAASELPSNVLLAIKQWGGEVGRTTLKEATLLRCTDSDVADLLSRHKGLEGMIEQIGPEAFIVTTENVASVRKALKSLNLSPGRPPTSTNAPLLFPDFIRDIPSSCATSPNLVNDEREDDEVTRGDEQGWIYSGASLNFYEADHSLPTYEDIFPSYQDIPIMWRTEMRSYHISTARKIVELAYEWQTKIIVRKNNTEATFLPKSLVRGKDWSIQGLLIADDEQTEINEMTLCLEQYDAMKLHLPTSN